MRNSVIIVAAGLLACGCCNTVIESGDMTLTVNGDMHYKVVSSAEGAGEYHSDFQAADALVADEAVIDNWNLRDVKECACEAGKTYTLHGTWEEDGYDIEKILTIKTLDGFEGMVLVNSSYVNHSDKILTVKALESIPADFFIKARRLDPSCRRKLLSEELSGNEQHRLRRRHPDGNSLETRCKHLHRSRGA